MKEEANEKNLGRFIIEQARIIDGTVLLNNMQLKDSIINYTNSDCILEKEKIHQKVKELENINITIQAKLDLLNLIVDRFISEDDDLRRYK